MMKAGKIYLGAIALLLSGCEAELKIIDSDVPQAVMAGFQARFPGAKDVEWEAEKENGRLVFEAEFDWEGKEREAHFRPDGSLAEGD